MPVNNSPARRERRQRAARVRAHQSPGQTTFYATILWAGGWDCLQIDPHTTRPFTEEERQFNQWRLENGHGLDPFLGTDGWVHSYFIREEGYSVGDDVAVKVIRRISHGD